MTYKEIAIKKITEMPTEDVSKVLIFMAGMEAEQVINKKKQQLSYKSSEIKIN